MVMKWNTSSTTFTNFQSQVHTCFLCAATLAHVSLSLIKVTRLDRCEHFVLHFSKWFQCHLFSSTWYMSKYHCIGSDHIMWKLSYQTLCKCQPCSRIFTYMSTRYLPVSHHSECNSLSVLCFVISPDLFKCRHISTQIQQSHER